MDHLRICMDALRRTASDAEGMRVHLGEQWIDQFCKAQSGSQKGPLKLLLNAIHNQAEQHPAGEDFWIMMGEYVQAKLRGLEPEEPLLPAEQ